MDRRERMDDAVEAMRAAQDGRQAQIWTALPAIVVSFDPAALTVSAQPAIQGSLTAPDGSSSSVNMPVLPDVPVVFPHGGGFALTYPLKPGDEVLVVFSSRCLDAWWQSGGVQAAAESRMHDLSDGMAIPGPWSQASRLSPPAHADNVQLRSDDGQQSITITPAGDMTHQCTGTLTLDAPQIVLKGNISTLGQSGPGTVAMQGTIALDGSMTSTGDQVAGGISQMQHTHTGVQPGGGNTGAPQ